MVDVDRVATLEFSPERKCMTTIVHGYQGKKCNQVLLKGAPERVLDKCTKIFTSTGEEKGLTEINRT